MKRTSTYFAKPGETTERWRLIDAQGQTLGRLARNIAIALQGKDKPSYAPHTMTGDFVVVTNAADLRVTGKKLDQKMDYRHSGYVGNIKSFRLKDLMENKSDRVLELAVKGMLPKNHHGR
ncbi:MAG: 50S ribosomal protein L13, partial [Chloroflexi bacterium]|nr:50S ribosomal protein L13 [Chloroflexota bacterium]